MVAKRGFTPKKNDRNCKEQGPRRFSWPGSLDRVNRFDVNRPSHSAILRCHNNKRKINGGQS